MALKAPAEVAFLVVMDSYVGIEPEDKKMQYFKMLEIIEQTGIIPEGIINQVAPNFFSKTTCEFRPELVKSFMGYMKDVKAYEISSLVRLGHMIFGRENRISQLEKIGAPTLIMTGENDVYRPPHEGQDMADNFRNAKFIFIPKAGHISNLEQPEITTNYLSDFIETSLQATSSANTESSSSLLCL